MADIVEMTASPARNVLTAVEFDVLWERLGLGPTPVVLYLPSPGATVGERREVQTRGWQALRDRGLAGPSGPDPELARQLRLLARPAEQLELRGSWGHTVRAMAAGGPGYGVLAVRRDATVTLEFCGSLPGALLGLLPTAVPGPGRAVTAPTSALAAGLAVPGPAMRATLIAQGLPPGEAGLVARMLGQTRGQAQVVALVADATGVARRAGGVISVVDAAAGRYLVTRRLAEDGVEWTTVAPTDDRRLRHRVAELLDDARAAQP